MLLKRLSKKNEYVYCISFGIYISVLLWSTLFSRIGTVNRGFLWPFNSYVQILRGNTLFLFENIANIVLFIPLGIILKWRGVKKTKKVIVVGFIISLFIETLQIIFGLGIFECDDLINNTLGVIIGCFFSLKKCGVYYFSLKPKKRIMIILCFSVVFLMPLVGNEILQHQRMIKLAAMNDSKEGKKNLLVLDGKNGDAWNTKVHIEYFSDGSIWIKGTSDRRSWWPIGELTLDSGTYLLCGLSGIEDKTVGLELVKGGQKFITYIGPIAELEFTLYEVTKLMIYVSVYDNCDCDIVIRPAIYKEE